MPVQDRKLTVTVRWLDSFLETFECREVRYSSRMLWMILENGQERLVPLQNVRWFSNSRISRQHSHEDRCDNGGCASAGARYPDFKPAAGSVKAPAASFSADPPHSSSGGC